MLLRKSDSICRLYPIGGIIWRPIEFTSTRMSPDLPDHDQEHLFEEQEDGTMVGRTHFNGNFLFEPVITGSHSGLITFIKNGIPDDWTHLVITGQSKGLRAPVNQRAKGCLFAEAFERKYSMEEYFVFRQELGLMVKANLNVDFETMVNISNEHWVNVDGIRSIISKVSGMDKNRDAFFEYQYLSNGGGSHD